MRIVEPQILTQIVAKPHDVYCALALSYASVISSGALTWPVGNSIVHASMSLNSVNIIRALPKDLEVSLSSLVISGPRLEEPLHMHPPHIIGFIEYGAGLLLTEIEHTQAALPFKKDDLVVIPSHTKHSFTTTPGCELRYNALLIGPSGGNYQAHYFD
jgi:hypothetical protein